MKNIFRNLFGLCPDKPSGSVELPTTSEEIKHDSTRFPPGGRRVTFKEIPLSSATGITISPDAKRDAYVVQHGNKWSVAIDGIEGKTYDGIGQNSLTWSPDSTRLAYGVELGDRCDLTPIAGHFISRVLPLV